MKKFICVTGGLFLLLSFVTQASIVKEVTIAQTNGVTAYNAAGTGTLNWTMGASGMVITSDWDVFLFDNATVAATFTGVTDLSSGGVAKATFSSGTWSMDLSQSGATVHLAGGIQGLYREEELPEGDALDGRAIVTLTAADFTGFDPSLDLQWGNSNMLGGIIASVLFTPGYGIQDYQSNYQSENTTITLLADETAIPEPATMLLLGLGAVLLRKKK
jgi:hypothetical protein